MIKGYYQCMFRNILHCCGQIYMYWYNNVHVQGVSIPQHPLGQPNPEQITQNQMHVYSPELFVISNTKFYVYRSIFSMSTSHFPYSIQSFRVRQFHIRTVHAGEEHCNIYNGGPKTIANKLKTSGMVATKLLRHTQKN